MKTVCPERNGRKLYSFSTARVAAHQKFTLDVVRPLRSGHNAVVIAVIAAVVCWLSRWLTKHSGNRYTGGSI